MENNKLTLCIPRINNKIRAHKLAIAPAEAAKLLALKRSLMLICKRLNMNKKTAIIANA